MAAHNSRPPPEQLITLLDEKEYNLNEEEIAFFKQQTGIQGDEELKQHLLRIRAEAFAIYPYPCIRLFGFTKLWISTLPAYQSVLELGRQREGAILLDLGCCFGTDIRKAIADGYPRENVVTSDLRQGFWDLGHKLFNDTSESFPVPFVAGDAFDSAHLESVPPFTADSPPTTPAPRLTSITSLNPLRGHVSVIYVSALFHLFDEGHQLQLAHALAGLLSPAPGSVIFGWHGGLPQKGLRLEPSDGHDMFCHSPESWVEMWDGVVFAKGSAKVEMRLTELVHDDFTEARAKFYVMSWAVTRL